VYHHKKIERYSESDPLVTTEVRGTTFAWNVGGSESVEHVMAKQR
jgi:hypothetical protein